MDIEIQLTATPIPGRSVPPPPGAGAWVEFRGVVRGEEAGRAIAALEYEAYAPMAERQMRHILEDLARQHPCLAARVVHRVGLVPVGEAAIYVAVAARHRAEAFALLAAFMDRLKQDVPIWKRRAIELESPAGLSNTSPAGTNFQSAPSRVSDLPTVQAAPGSNNDLPVAADAVVALVRSLCPLLEAERVDLAVAGGRVLREPVTTPEDQPPFDRAAMDGFAVRLDDRSTTFRVVDAIRAGDWKPHELRPGEAVRVATGGALPDEGLQVIPQEDTHVEGDRVTVLRREPERFIRFRGEDARAGQVLVEAGTVLSPGALALLAGLGVARPLVARLPRVVHLATGNEIVPPDQAPTRGQIRDSNSTLVRAFLAGWGIVPEQTRVAEDASALASGIGHLASGVSAPDLLLISGGASVGAHDFTRRALEAAGFTIHVRKTAARPGKPLLVATRGATLAFGLPGNPLAHFVCLHLYVRAALEAWSGQPATGFTPGVLAAELAADGSARETFWPARWHWAADGTVRLTPLRWSSSGDLTALATANALVWVPAGTERLARGRPVQFLRAETGS